jgi:hypothetical protein
VPSRVVGPLSRSYKRCLTLPATTLVAVQVKVAGTFWLYFSILDTATYNAN